MKMNENVFVDILCIITEQKMKDNVFVDILCIIPEGKWMTMFLLIFFVL